MVFRIGWISMGARLSYEFCEKPASITHPRRRSSPLGAHTAHFPQSQGSGQPALA